LEKEDVVMDEPKVDPKKDKRQPAASQDDEEQLVQRDGYAGPLGQVESDLDIEVDGAEVSGITQPGDGHKGRKPLGGAS
jgi:hypothetical protein